jgi:hypothetical protein
MLSPLTSRGVRDLMCTALARQLGRDLDGIR